MLMSRLDVRTVKGIEDPVSARDVLKSSLVQSRNIAFEIHKTSAKVSGINQQVPPLEAAFKNIAHKCTLFTIRDPVACTIGPASAVLNVFEAVHELPSMLSAHSYSDLCGYLYVFKQLEEALRLLASNCKLVILWLEDVAQFLVDNAVIVDEWYLFNVKKYLVILKELHDIEECSRCNRGILCEACATLENEFSHRGAKMYFRPNIVPKRFVQNIG